MFRVADHVLANMICIKISFSAWRICSQVCIRREMISLSRDREENDAEEADLRYHLKFNGGIILH